MVSVYPSRESGIVMAWSLGGEMLFSSADMEGWAESRKAHALIGNNIFMVNCL